MNSGVNSSCPLCGTHRVTHCNGQSTVNEVKGGRQITTDPKSFVIKTLCNDQPIHDGDRKT
jgi:hypothetical protein